MACFKKSSRLRAYLFRVAFFMLLFVGLCPQFISAKNSPDIFLKAEISNRNPFEGEAVIYNISLYSKTPDIQYVRRVEDTVLKGGDESYLSRIETGSRGRREKVNGETYFVFPVESYVLSVGEKGSYNYMGGAFEVEVLYPVVVSEDPYRGRYEYKRVDKRFLTVPAVSFKVKKLPAPEDKDVSGSSVGNFTLSTFVPPGDIILEQPARVLITLRGRGLIGGDVLPEYTDAFKGDKIKLKSMSESRSLYFDGNSVVSELTLDCEFIPLDKEAEVGSVRFRFFNPKKGKYEETESSPVKVEVRSITSKVETMDV